MNHCSAEQEIGRFAIQPLCPLPSTASSFCVIPPGDSERAACLSIIRSARAARTAHCARARFGSQTAAPLASCGDFSSEPELATLRCLLNSGMPAMTPPSLAQAGASQRPQRIVPRETKQDTYLSLRRAGKPNIFQVKYAGQQQEPIRITSRRPEAGRVGCGQGRRSRRLPALPMLT